MKLSPENLKWYVRSWLRIAQGLEWLYIKAHGYRFMSWLHQRIMDRKWDDVPLTRFKSLQEIADKAKTFVWKEDGFDAVCTPQKVEAVGFNGTSPHGNDCDEAARYNALAILRAKEDGHIDSSITPLWLDILWMYENGYATGHNVTLLVHHHPDKTTYSYMDYGDPSEEVDSVEEVVYMVRERFTQGRPYVGFTWYVADPVSMKPLVFNLG